MNWLEFLELTSIQVKGCPLKQYQQHKKELNLRRRRKLYQSLSTQSSQIKDLRVKLDGAIAKNAQIRELLNPATLQTAFTNALQALGQHFRTQGKFFGKRRDPVVAAGIDGTTDPDKSCNYCKGMGHEKDNCLHLKSTMHL